MLLYYPIEKYNIDWIYMPVCVHDVNYVWKSASGCNHNNHFNVILIPF